MDIAQLVSERSTCLRRKVGAVLVREKRILCTGYNGAAHGLQHCDEVGCLRDKLHIRPAERIEICRGIHAEQNALVQAAAFGISVSGRDALLHARAVHHLLQDAAERGHHRVRGRRAVPGQAGPHACSKRPD